MRAMLIASDGTLELREVPDPRPGPGEVVVAVRAASVNRADLAQREGRYDPALGSADRLPVAGTDAAGVVVEVGRAVADVRVGDRVMGFVSGGYAELALLDHRLAIPVPSGWSVVEAAAAVAGLMTEHDALVRTARLRAGEAVVVHGAGAAVGLTGVQLAVFLGARPVIATTRGDRADDLVLAAGADLVVHTARESFADRVLAATGGAGADVIVDHVGGPYLEDSIRCLAVEGRLVSVGRLGGDTGPLDLEQLAYKRGRVIGVTFRTRSLEQHAEIARGVVADLLPAMQQGSLRPIVDRAYPLARAMDAHARMASNEHRGKIVLVIEHEACG